jgi:hypothetical protein
VPQTIFWPAIVAVCFWLLVYVAVLSGFLFYPPRRPSARRPAISALGYATAIWLFCAGILFMGSYFFALLIVIMLALAFLFVRQTIAKHR